MSHSLMRTLFLSHSQLLLFSLLHINFNPFLTYIFLLISCKEVLLRLDQINISQSAMKSNRIYTDGFPTQRNKCAQQFLGTGMKHYLKT